MASNSQNFASSTKPGSARRFGPDWDGSSVDAAKCDLQYDNITRTPMNQCAPVDPHRSHSTQSDTVMQQPVSGGHFENTLIANKQEPKLRDCWKNQSYLLNVMLTDPNINNTVLVDRPREWYYMLTEEDPQKLKSVIGKFVGENLKIAQEIEELCNKPEIYHLVPGLIKPSGEDLARTWDKWIRHQGSYIPSLLRLLEIFMIIQLQLREAKNYLLEFVQPVRPNVDVLDTSTAVTESPYVKSEDEMLHEIKQLQQQNKILITKNKSLEKRQKEQLQIHLESNERLKKEYEKLKSKLQFSEQQYYERCKTLFSQIQELDKQNKSMDAKIQYQITDLKKSKELLTRLSMLAGAKLTHGNPDITDLSDENRPTKLAEKFLELYDNEWTDSLEELLLLTKSEVKSININLDIVSSAYKFCSSISQLHADQLIHTLQFLPHLSDEPVLKQPLVEENCATIPQHIKKDIEDIRLSLAPQMISVAEEKFVLVAAKVVQKHLCKNRLSETLSGTHPGHKGQPWGFEIEHVDGASGYLNTGKQTEYGQHTKNEEFESASSLNELLAVFERIPSTKVFAKRCAHLCWLMRIRDPKLHMLCDIRSKDNIFDTEKFRYYTRTGKRLDFVVWPALFLFESGPLLSKGVAQASS